jgi:hypothetical protein
MNIYSLNVFTQSAIKYSFNLSVVTSDHQTVSVVAKILGNDKYDLPNGGMRIVIYSESELSAEVIRAIEINLLSSNNEFFRKHTKALSVAVIDKCSSLGEVFQCTNNFVLYTPEVFTDKYRFIDTTSINGTVEHNEALYIPFPSERKSAMLDPKVDKTQISGICCRHNIPKYAVIGSKELDEFQICNNFAAMDSSNNRIFVMDIDTVDVFLNFESISKNVGYYVVEYFGEKVYVWVSSKHTLVKGISNRQPTSFQPVHNTFQIDTITNALVYVFMCVVKVLKFADIQYASNCLYSYDDSSDTLLFVGSLPRNVSTMHKKNLRV